MPFALCADDAVALFERCRTGLKPDGFIFVKENICPAEQNFVVDEVFHFFPVPSAESQSV